MSESSDSIVNPSVASTSGRTTGTYEVKFLVQDDVADEALMHARRHLAADRHCDPPISVGYLVTSLYFDTPTLDTYYRNDGYRRRKFRIRRYGSESSVMLERKSKARRLVKTRRTTVPDREVSHLMLEATPADWQGDWFHSQLRDRQLAPTCNLSYTRFAHVCTTPEGPIQLTVVRELRCRRAEEIALPFATEGSELLGGMSIVEMTFCVAMPAVFKAIISEMALMPSRVSKFRLSIEECVLSGIVRPPMAASVAAGLPVDHSLMASNCG